VHASNAPTILRATPAALAWNAGRKKPCGDSLQSWRFVAIIRVIVIWGLAALCGYLAVLTVHDRLPWTTPNTHHLGRWNWYVWGGRLFIHHSYDVDKADTPPRDFRAGKWRARHEVFSFFPPDSDGEPDQTQPIRHVATLNLRIPTWPLLILLGFYPTYVLVSARKRRRERMRRQGLCVECSYNLTGNTSGVCPECGKRVDLPKT
jgi:hypothetical protein